MSQKKVTGSATQAGGEARTEQRRDMDEDARARRDRVRALLSAIRPATPRDLPGVNALVRAAKASWGYPDEWLERWWSDLEVTPALLARGDGWLVAEEAEILGFYLILPEEPEWLLDHLWVAPSVQRRGIGGALLAHACRRAAAAGRTGMRIDSDPFAEPFYTRAGAVRRSVVAAPMPGAPDRVRPQLWLPLKHP